MKFLKLVFAAAFFAATTAYANEGHTHASGGGLFGLPPEYIHILINPLPIYGLAMGILTLIFAFVARNKTAQNIGLGLIVITCALAWPVTHYGTNAYEHIRELSDDAGVDALDDHMERAEKWIYVFYATAFLGVVALISRKKFPRAATALALATLFLATTSLAAGGWIAKAGGQIRHPEFRNNSASPETPQKTNHEPDLSK